MKTARYANRTLQTREDLVPVRTSRGGPRFKLGYPLEHAVLSMAPDRSLWGLSLEDFVPQYEAQLQAVGVAKLKAQIQAIERKTGKEAVLLCFEDIRKPGQWCHRRVFANWWYSQTGELVEEVPESVAVAPAPSKLVTPVNPKQGSLF